MDPASPEREERKIEDGLFIKMVDDPSLEFDVKLKGSSSLGNQIFASRIDPEDDLVALATDDGLIQIFELWSNKLLKTIYAYTKEPLAATCLRWRPPISAKSKGTLVSSCADGNISYWHASTGKLVHRIIEEGNLIFALDFRNDGELLATGGKDYNVRVYDENTKKVVKTFSEAQWQKEGHSNRIFSVKFVNDNPNLIISGGWDLSVNIWDLRQDKRVGFLLGPNINGDSIDYLDGKILTGSYESRAPLQVWDIGTRDLIKSIEWTHSNAIHCYGAQYVRKAPNLIVACSAGSNQIKVFDSKQDYKNVCTIENSPKGFYTLDSHHTKPGFLVAGHDGIFYEFGIDPK